jgi:hypothetical protein
MKLSNLLVVLFLCTVPHALFAFNDAAPVSKSPTPSAPATQATPKRRAPVAIEDGLKVYIIHVGGGEYHIPVGYFKLSIRPKDREEAIGITASYPSMASYERSDVVTDDEVIVLVHDARSTTSAETRAKIIRQEYGPLTPLSTRFGLMAYRTSRGPSGTIMEKSRTLYLGNTIIAHPTDEQREQAYDEFYADNNSSSPSLFITCIGDTGTPRPGCTAVFATDDLLYQVHFPKVHLSEWEAIKSSTISLVEQFKR